MKLYLSAYGQMSASQQIHHPFCGSPFDYSFILHNFDSFIVHNSIPICPLECTSFIHTYIYTSPNDSCGKPETDELRLLLSKALCCDWAGLSSDLIVSQYNSV